MASKIDLSWVDVLEQQPQQEDEFDESLVTQVEAFKSALSGESLIINVQYYQKEIIDEVAKKLRLLDSDLTNVLTELSKSNFLVGYKDNYYRLNEKQAICSIQIRQSRNGGVIGFAKSINHIDLEDIFVPPRLIEKYFLMDGDVILVDYNYAEKGNEAIDVAIVSNLIVNKVGYLLTDTEHKKSVFTFTFTNGTLTERIRPTQFKMPAEDAVGKLVVVELQRKLSRFSDVTIEAVLIQAFEANNEIEENQIYSALKFNLDTEFTPDNLAKARSYGDSIPESSYEYREDLTSIPLVTIDGEDAKDFDDAVYVEKSKSQFRLVVAIADVSYYVRENDPIDKQAKHRTTSVYFPNKVIPMLPHELSNELCSLKPNVERLSLVADINFDNSGNMLGYKFYNAVIKSHGRLTYNQVQHWKDTDFADMGDYAELKEPLQNLYELYDLLAKQRAKRGTISLESQEVAFSFDKDGEVEGLHAKGRVDSHKLIEEMMIAANVASALFVTNSGAIGLYRNHQKPKEERVKKLVAYLNTLGVVMPNSDNPSPSDYSKAIENMHRIDAEKGLPIQAINLAILRSMSQAVYSAENIGHFGLALSHYSHFTSPIRRYPDLMIHRIIKSLLAAEDSKLHKLWGAKSYIAPELEALCQSSSEGERNADAAVYDFVAWLKARYMKMHLGEAFLSTISSVTNFGIFVTIPEYQIEGLVHISHFPQNTRIDLDLQRIIFGKRHLTLGDTVAITVSSVDLGMRKIDFALATSAEAFAIKRSASVKEKAENYTVDTETNEKIDHDEAWEKLHVGYQNKGDMQKLINTTRTRQLNDLDFAPSVKGKKIPHKSSKEFAIPLNREELLEIHQSAFDTTKSKDKSKSTKKAASSKVKNKRKTEEYKKN